MIRFALLLALVATGAVAQPVTIRSGDHPDFARLVLTVPEGSDWDVGRIEGGIGIVLPEAGTGVDISSVFERIPRDRIGDIEVDGPLLRLRLLCDCHADAFLWRSDRLVVDIVDGPSPPDNPFDQPLATESPDPIQRDILPILIARNDPHRILREMLPPAFTPKADVEGLDQAQAAVLSSLARAATEGFFDIPVEPVPGPFATSVDGGSGETRATGLSPITDPMSGLGTALGDLGGPGLVLRSGLSDKTLASLAPSGPPSDCLPDQSLDLGSWSDGTPFADQISRRRSALTGEFDRYQSGAVEGLARTYIHFGFGAEARLVLSLDGNRSVDRVLLQEMARIVDGDVVPNGRLAEQADCAGRVALWHLLARGEASDTGPDIRGEAVREFRILPAHLKAHLGPRLAAILVAAGDQDRAMDVMEQVPELGSEEAVESALVRARINEVSGSADETEQQLASLAEDSARLPPDAAADLLELQLGRGEVPAPEQIELAQALLYESRPAGGNDRLAAAVVRSLIAAGRFDDAEAVLDESLPSGSALHAQMFNSLILARAERLPDAEVLELTVADLPEIVSPEVAVGLADKLIRMGFPTEALRVLDGAVGSPGNPGEDRERRYLRALAHARLGQVADVERVLEGRDDARAREIRAEARALNGDYLGALAETGPIAEPDQKNSLAWRAGDWESLETSGDDLLRMVAQLAQQPTFLGPDLAELEARHALLQEASRTREVTEDLLERFSLDALSDGNTE